MLKMLISRFFRFMAFYQAFPRTAAPDAVPPVVAGPSEAYPATHALNECPAPRETPRGCWP